MLQNIFESKVCPVRGCARVTCARAVGWNADCKVQGMVGGDMVSGRRRQGRDAFRSRNCEMLFTSFQAH